MNAPECFYLHCDKIIKYTLWTLARLQLNLLRLIMKEGWVTVEGVSTHIFTWGQWIEDKFNEKEVILMITGNLWAWIFYIGSIDRGHIRSK